MGFPQREFTGRVMLKSIAVNRKLSTAERDAANRIIATFERIRESSL